jgi:hypothetical protein
VTIIQPLPSLAGFSRLRSDGILRATDSLGALAHTR